MLGPACESNLKHSESIRLFNLIQQTIAEPRSNLNAESLRHFLDLIFPNHNSNPVTFLHNIDKQGREMNEAYFGSCISLAMQDSPLSNQLDLKQFHEDLKQFLVGKYYKNFTKLEVWDRGQSMNQAQMAEYYNRIQEVSNQLLAFSSQFQPNTFDTLAPKIRFYLSIGTLHPSLKEQIIEKYKAILKGNLLETLHFVLTKKTSQNSNYKDILKCLAYLIGAMKHEPLRLIMSGSWLYHPSNWSYLMNFYMVRDSEVRMLVSIIGANLAIHSPEFATYVLTNNQVLQVVGGNIATMSDMDGLCFSMQFLATLIKRFPEQDREWQNSHTDLISHMFGFGMGNLTKNDTIEETRIQCIRLLSHCIKLIELSEDQLNRLKIISQIFQSHNVKLQIEILELLETAIRVDNSKVVNMIMSESSFVDFIKTNIKARPENLQQMNEKPFCHALYAAFLFSFSAHIKYFFEKDLIEPILQLSTLKQGFQTSVVSRILLNLIANSLDSEWRMAYMHEKHILGSLGCLLSNSLMEDRNMQGYLPQELDNFLYFNKQTFLNVFKALYLLSESQHASTTDRTALFTKNFTRNFIVDVRRGLESFFHAKSDKIVVSTLKEDVSIVCPGKDTLNIKLFKLIHLFIQNLMDQMGDKEKDVLKDILITKRMYYEKLYSFATLNELEVHGIPLELKILLKYDRAEKMIRLNKVEWSSLKLYINGWLEAVLHFKVSYFKAKDMDRDVEIKDQLDYRDMMNRALTHYHESKFRIRLSIMEVREKTDLVERLQHPVTASYAFRANDRVSQFGTTIVPNQRAHTPNVPRHMTSSFNVAPERQTRSPMPNAGVLHKCPICNTVTNNLDLCRECLGRT